MASTATLQNARTHRVRETLPTADAPSLSRDSKVLNHSAFDRAAVTYDASHTETPVSKGTAHEIAMVEGAATLDLTAIPTLYGDTITLNTLKVKSLLLKNPSTNANAITVGEGASNGYELCGSGWQVTLDPGDEIEIWKPNGGPAVGALAKEIDISGTDTQVLQFSISAGPDPA